MLLYLLEDEFFKQVIGEIFVELHFNLPAMKSYWGHLPDAPKLKHMLDTFRKIREDGIRIHYWV